jgi:hypothetical protein
MVFAKSRVAKTKLQLPLPIRELFAEGDFLEFADGGAGMASRKRKAGPALSILVLEVWAPRHGSRKNKNLCSHRRSWRYDEF